MIKYGFKLLCRYLYYFVGIVVLTMLVTATKEYVLNISWQGTLESLHQFVLPAFVFFAIHTGIEYSYFYSIAKNQQVPICWIIDASYGLGWGTFLLQHDDFKEEYLKAIGWEEEWEK